MRNPDEAIDKGLQALSRGAPPAGMESRILRTLDALEQASASSSTASRWFDLPVLRFLNTFPRTGIASAVCVLTVCLLAWVWGVSSRQSTTGKLNRVTLNPAHRSTLAPEAAVEPLRVVRLARPLQPVAGRRVEKSDSSLDLSGQASSEAVADHPAPPLPLTRQEQLLLQLARHQNAQVRALLDPAQQNRLLAQNDEQFDRFFVPPPQSQELEQPAAPGGNE